MTSRSVSSAASDHARGTRPVACKRPAAILARVCVGWGPAGQHTPTTNFRLGLVGTSATRSRTGAGRTSSVAGRRATTSASATRVIAVITTRPHPTPGGSWLPASAVRCTTPDDPLCRSLGRRHGHPRRCSHDEPGALLAPHPPIQRQDRSLRAPAYPTTSPCQRAGTMQRRRRCGGAAMRP